MFALIALVIAFFRSFGDKSFPTTKRDARGVGSRGFRDSQGFNTIAYNKNMRNQGGGLGTRERGNAAKTITGGAEGSPMKESLSPEQRQLYNKVLDLPRKKPATLRDSILNYIDREHEMLQWMERIHFTHPMFARLQSFSTRRIMQEGMILFLEKNQLLYRLGKEEFCFYIIVFGSVVLAYRDAEVLQVSVGGIVGEETLFEEDYETRREDCYAGEEAAVLEITNHSFARIRDDLKEYAKEDLVFFHNILVKNYNYKIKHKGK